MRRTSRSLGGVASALQRGRSLMPVVAAATATLLIVRGIAPAPAQAGVDLFPIDDWIGDGLRSIGKVALGPLKLGAEAIAKLLGSIVAALADLLIPKSLIEAGVGAIRWLVELPPLGYSPTPPQAVAAMSMPHLVELRDTLTWIGLTLLPLQLVLTGGRALLSPTADGDSPSEVLQRTIAAAVGLLCFDWLWGALTQLVQLVTTALLGLPWVADGVERMLEALVIGGAAGTAVAAEFVIPLLLAVTGAVLLALMLLRVGLEVIASIVYATGGLALGLSVSGGGHRLLQAWTVAAAAVFVLPVLWCVVFVTGAALMVDAGGDGTRGFGDFVGQLFNVGAALVTFAIAIKLARATLGHAGTAITGLAATARFSHGATRGGRATAGALMGTGGRGTPQSLARFSQGLRGGMRGAAAGAVRVGAFPVRHPVQAAAGARHPVQATNAAAQQVRDSIKDGAHTNIARNRDERRGQSESGGRHQPSGATRPTSRPNASRASRAEADQPASVTAHRAQARPAAGSHPAVVRPSAAPDSPASVAGRPRGERAAAPVAIERNSAPLSGGGSRAAAATPVPTGDAAAARAWQTTRRVVAPAKRRKPTRSTKRDRKKS